MAAIVKRSIHVMTTRGKMKAMMIRVATMKVKEMAMVMAMHMTTMMMMMKKIARGVKCKQ